MIWFLCAIGFLKVSQKIDSFMSSLGVNVGQTGGSMLAEAVIATRGVAAVAGAFGGVARHSAGSSTRGISTGTTGPFGGFLKGGLAGAVSRKVTRDAVRTATTATSAVNTVTSTAAAAVSQSRTIREQQADTIRQTDTQTGTHQETQTASAHSTSTETISQTAQQTEMATAKTFQQSEHTAQQSATQTTSQASHTTSTVRQADKRAAAPDFKGVGLGGAIFAKSLLSGGSFANDIIGTVARGDIRSTGSITGDLAAQSIRSYLGCAGEEASGKSPLTFSNVEIGGGRITGMVSKPDIYYLNLLITITAASVDELEWRCAEMKKLLLSQDMDVQPCSFCQEQAFLSSLPLVSLEHSLFERSKRNVLTLGAASCYPFTSYEMCDDNGILLGVNKHNNSLIIVDIFDSRVYKNANIAILGTSGAGKSFSMQLMATRMRRKGIQVFIVAPLKGHEFHRACSNIGGEFIQISPASQNCINVMAIRKVDRSVDEMLDGPGVEKSLLAAKIQRLHIFFSLLIPDMNHEERQLLDDALIRTYAQLGITHDNSTLDDPDHPGQYRTMPVLGDLYEVLKESSDTKRLANIINRLVNGSARTFNQQTNVSLDNKYTVLDISELTGDLLTVGMFVALDFVWDKAKENRTEEKAIFIDECWQLIGANSNRLAAEFVLEIFKIIRGYGGSAICATQDINDFFALEDGKYGKGIINNAKTKILLNLEEEEARRVQSILHLSEAEVMEITHFERGSGLISTNNNNVTVEIKCSQLEKELITTDRRELRELLGRES